MKQLVVCRGFAKAGLLQALGDRIDRIGFTCHG
jgi:hypothetical protein